MILSFIVAAAEDNAIGRDNKLPWHLPEDLKFFKRTTMGKPVLMGRRTYESLGRPLPGRLNIVLTTNKDLPVAEGVLVYSQLAAAIERLQQEPVEEGFVIGGGKVFTEMMDQADRVYMTRVATTVPGADAFFPAIDHTHWKMTREEQYGADEKHEHAFALQVFDRVVF